MAVSVAAQWRGAVDFSSNYGQLGFSVEQSDHIQAFILCLALADRNIRKHAGSREVATVVAEDVPEMRRFLRDVPKVMRSAPVNLKQDHMRKTLRDEEAGISAKEAISELLELEVLCTLSRKATTLWSKLPMPAHMDSGGSSLAKNSGLILHGRLSATKNYSRISPRRAGQNAIGLALAPSYFEVEGSNLWLPQTPPRFRPHQAPERFL